MKNGNHEETIILKFNATTVEIFHCFREKKVTQEEEALNIDKLEYCHNLQSWHNITLPYWNLF